MGNCCLPSRFRRTPSAVNPKKVTLLLLGLDNSGKTTIVKRLAGEPLDSVVPTVGFAVILLRQRGCQVSIYDLGGGPQIRNIWPRYYADAHGIIFVADAHDGDKLDECRKVLEKVLRHDQISGKPVLLLANKQDLEGALDEIDIVDRLNLERIVNEQKCPTLVELCSALNFSKKIDIGIENGYKWLIRSIIRDYPSLNNRVLKDLAKQEEESKVEAIRRVKRSRERDEGIFNHVDGNPFKPLNKMLEEKAHVKAYPNRKKSQVGVKTIAVIPGLIDEGPQRTKEKKHAGHRGGAPRSPVRSTASSSCSEFFVLEKFQSDLELLNDVPNHSFKSFLVRPKSSGARLYGVKSEKKKTHKRKPLKRMNKTRPSPFTDISNGQAPGKYPQLGVRGSSSARNPGGRFSAENVNPFVLADAFHSVEKGGDCEMTLIFGSKSVPNSRRNSVCLARKRRHSMANTKLEGLEKLNRGLSSTKEIILDATRLQS